jgi:eukaryotic-like serine/threonine-protein kinase
MNERLAKAEALFHDALALPPEQRDTFLQSACAADADLLAEVSALLRAAGVADQWLKDEPREGAVPPAPERPGTLIGRYKLLEKIGEGGFGIVYMAEQQEPIRRRVALKVIKLGMDTRSVIDRFEAERQALALMDHPNIAKVLDAGATDTGRPYFVMELVRGVPITKFCEDNQLNLTDCLELFIQVCSAIQHAHQKGIIHRDIKPTNVLVTLNDGVPHPMVIDFGVAKALNQRLTEKTLFTNFAQMIGTPAYMSPEQAEMSKLDVDTRSDVYSLGVLLYELLTGTTPFPEERLRSAGYAEMQRIICEEEPERPSTRLTRSLVAADVSRRHSAFRAPRSAFPTDLDWIVMKCLEKDRTRRYDTASALALDLRRHLSDEPILARPASNIYRFQTLVRRNKLAFGAGALVAAILIIGFALSTWLFFRERAALRVAATNAHESRRNLYAADMILAQAALEAGNIGRAKQLLSKYLPTPGEQDLRGWEWRYAWNQCRSDELFTLEGHTMNVTSLALSTNGAILASGSLDRTVIVWDLRRKKPIRILPQTDSVYGLVFSRDRKELIAGSKDGQVTFWNCETWQRTGTLPGPSWVRSLAVSPDGKLLAVFGTHFLTLWEMASRQEIARLKLRWSRDLAPGGVVFSPDSSLLAYSKGDGAIVLWDLAEAKIVGELLGHERYVSALAFSPDGSILVSGSRDRTARVWDIRSRKELRQLGNFAGWVGCVAFSSDGRHLAVAGSGQRVLLFDTRSWAEINTLRGHSEEVWAAVFAPDGRSLLTGAKDMMIKSWAVSADQHPASYRLPADVNTAFIMPEAKRLYLTHTNGTYSLWRTDPFEELERYPARLADWTFSRVSADGKFWVAATTNGAVKVFNQINKRWVADLTGPFVSSYRIGVAFSSDGQMFVGVGTDHICRLWKGGDFQQTGAFGIGVRTVSCLKFLDSGSLLGIGDWAGEAEIWNTAARQKVATLRGHAWSILDIAISRDGSTVATSSGDGRVKLWNLQSQREVASLGGQLNTCFSVAFSPDESRIAACSGDGTVKLWDTETKQEVASLKIHNYLLHQLAFSTDDDSLNVLAVDPFGRSRLFILRAPKGPE